MGDTTIHVNHLTVLWVIPCARALEGLFKYLCGLHFGEQVCSPARLLSPIECLATNEPTKQRVVMSRVLAKNVRLYDSHSAVTITESNNAFLRNRLANQRARDHGFVSLASANR